MRFVLSIASGVLLVGAASAPVLSQTSDISGVVVTETGRPLANVQITLQGTRLGAVTDANGEFRVAGIAGVAGGEVTVRALRIGYQAPLQTVRLGATDVRIVMSEVAIRLDE